MVAELKTSTCSGSFPVNVGIGEADFGDITLYTNPGVSRTYGIKKNPQDDYFTLSIGAGDVSNIASFNPSHHITLPALCAYLKSCDQALDQLPYYRQCQTVQQDEDTLAYAGIVGGGIAIIGGVGAASFIAADSIAIGVTVCVVAPLIGIAMICMSIYHLASSD